MNIQFIYDHPVKTIFKVYQRGNDIRRWSLKDLSNNKKVKIITNTSAAIEKMPEFHDKNVIAVQEVKTLSHGIGCSQATPKYILDKLQKSARKLHLVF